MRMICILTGNQHLSKLIELWHIFYTDVMIYKYIIQVACFGSYSHFKYVFSKSLHLSTGLSPAARRVSVNGLLCWTACYISYLCYNIHKKIKKQCESDLDVLALLTVAVSQGSFCSQDLPPAFFIAQGPSTPSV